MDENLYCSPLYYCMVCKANKSSSDFLRNHVGAPYSVCKPCKEKTSRAPLQEVDVNSRRRLRSVSATSIINEQPPARKRRGRPSLRSRIPVLERPVDLDPTPLQPIIGRPQTLYVDNAAPIAIPEPLPPLDTTTTLPNNHSVVSQLISSTPVSLRAPEPPIQLLNQPANRLRGRPRGRPQGRPQGHPRSAYKGFLSCFNPNKPPYTVGRMHHECDYCVALHFAAENSGNAQHSQYHKCCANGTVRLDPIKAIPPFLRNLYTSQTPDGQEFRKNIRRYNNALAFTSISYNKDTRIDFSRGVQVFSVHGELYHKQGPLIPGSQETPQFAQLLFYDPEYATDVRMDRNPCLNRSILRQLSLQLLDCNPFISLYKTAYERLREQDQMDGEQLRILLSPQMRLIVEHGADRRRENLPTTSEIALLIPDEYSNPCGRDLVISVRNPIQGRPTLENVSVNNAAYMPLHYVLLFPNGDHGFHWALVLTDGESRLEQRMFYRYRLSIRKSEFSPLFYAQGLFQQYIVDAYIACETSKLDWLKKHQESFRADIYNGLTDALRQGDVNATTLGKRFILPASFTGSKRYMQHLYQDAMALVRCFKKPTFFITFTANPRWPDILSHLFPGQQPGDRPDITTRVFFHYVDELLTDLKKDILGPYIAHFYVIEYQKRGLPHVHLLLFIDKQFEWGIPERIDQVICAELPDPSWDPTGELTDLVMKSMSHGPCGADNPKSPCMTRKTPTGSIECSKRFPKQFAHHTIIRDDGRIFTVPKPGFPDEEVVRDNRWVVLYNPYLLQKFRAHINVEMCASIKAIKYLGDYVTKGHDKSTVRVEHQDDEYAQHCHGRYVSPCEGFARIFEFTQYSNYPSVTHLAVHLQNEHAVYFRDDLTPSQIEERKELACSTLMGFFKYNQNNADGRSHLYLDFPRFYTWHKDRHAWEPRKKGKAIGRMYYCSPLAGERYYLRLLLTVAYGPTSFEDLYSFGGVRYSTYRDACVARGLASDNKEWIRCFIECCVFTSGSGLRMLFVLGLRQESITDPIEIWDRFKDHFCDDLLHRIQESLLRFPHTFLHPEHDYGLYLIGQGLAEGGKGLADYQLSVNTFDWSVIDSSIRREESMTDSANKASQLREKLNTDQAACFDTIVSAITTSPETAHFYLQGPGGTGKTFLYKTICHHFRGIGVDVLCVASTGIAALLLPNGRTAHTRFKIPLALHESATCSITMSSPTASMLRSIGLIIWDEVPMQHKHCFEVVHRLFCDLRALLPTDPHTPLFGGTPFILGGDFAQILPVVKKGSRADVVTACLQRSFIWPRLKQLRLRVNMRIRNGLNDDRFKDWVSSLPYSPTLHGSISLPDFISRPKSITDLIQLIYPLSILKASNLNYTAFRDRAILTTRNDTVRELNAVILNMFSGDIRTYESEDSTDASDTDGIDQVPVEFLKAQSPSGLPLAKLHLKVGAPIMLLRNIHPEEGLCNGTRMVITRLCNNCIQCRILGGEWDGQLRVIPRVKLEYTGEELPFALYRLQFPIRLCFAMTINKSQGQTFEYVGLDLRYPVFSHGQFYVAVSRISSVAGLHILLSPERSLTTDNVVYSEVLKDLN